MNPYINQRPLMQNMQDLSGQQPVFMNEAAQDQMHRALLQQNLGSPVGQGRSLGINPVALAQMLRQGQTSNPYANAQMAMNQYGAENVYGFGGQGQVPTTTTGMN